jgi:hypothetical protein
MPSPLSVGSKAQDFSPAFAPVALAGLAFGTNFMATPFMQ